MNVQKMRHQLQRDMAGRPRAFDGSAYAWSSPPWAFLTHGGEHRYQLSRATEEHFSRSDHFWIRARASADTGTVVCRCGATFELERMALTSRT